MKRTLGRVAEMCGGRLLDPACADNPIRGVSRDSRSLEPDCLFVPLGGANVDGHAFVAGALQGGAGASFWQKGREGAPDGPIVEVDDVLEALQTLASAYLRETGAKVVGITGSNGKTTTKDMVFSLLETRFRVHKTQGNFNNHLGLPLTLLGMPENSEIVVLEMGMSGLGEIELLAKIAPPDVAIVTNIGESHLLTLGSRENIARAKLEIAAGAKPGGLLIYNGDEPLIHAVLGELEPTLPQGLRTFTFGLDAGSDDYPTGMMQAEGGMTFTAFREGETTFTLPVLGSHNVTNALAAMAAARELGVGAEEMHAGLIAMRLTGMRIERLTGASGLTILNDAYNSSPTSARAAIDVLAGMKGYDSKTLVLGDMLELGEREIEYHREVGRYAGLAGIDAVYAYGPLSAAAAEGARETLPEHAVRTFTDKQAMIRELSGSLGPSDAVLVKASRGMKLEEVVYALQNAAPAGENGA
ncbi:UDP-N-acetylmuramoyl-tripeptide--D-alanyl-D-alanine ligase [Saccharibacillus sp. CPCC 101409]|uniref:UDP-N-acetylmuramoyl-tripeptide--D-alanyl-D- alanine ligase n=1 Tax=Saccharibacillus sp. CPCC 101409 TaxID=3058041 RepID=UPI002671343B|nr:UDP-N-acetylmuramoyl-tripeptide--D-alanyl-D-alanine ligase [Saccharibacillus sp. CPCC 101409]MDO3409209.1 UDP-N-acetylmuramoyl-tripeptide--D-alanyl-D-alanine ligase [Saccharibacillus sp. CPCC 101409]